MPRRAKELSAAEVRRKSKPGYHAVGGVNGLLLCVKPTGSKSWILRVVVGSKRRDIGLGGFPTVTLTEARDKAREARKLIEQGIDPVDQRKALRAALIAEQATRITFDEAVRRFMSGKVHEFTNAKHAAQWSSTLEMYASPVLGKLPVADVELTHIIEILEPIWTTKTETATRLRGRIEAVLAWATVAGFRSGDNPARWKGHLDAVLPKPTKIRAVRHHRALPVAAIGAFMADLRQQSRMGARAVEFCVLTAARSGEVRGATWDEIDLKAKVWVIPASRMKAKREHKVPLATDAVKLLQDLPRFPESPYVFPAPRGGQLSDMSLTAVLRRMEADATVHGFRSTFRDWAAECTNFPRDVCEMALAHTIGDKVEAAYRRGDLFAKRIRLMDQWAMFCRRTKSPSDVVPLRRAVDVT